MSKPVVVIYDDGLGCFGPLTDLRPVFDLRTGALTTRQRIERVLGSQAQSLLVPAEYRAILAAREPQMPLSHWRDDADDILLVNARCATAAALEQVRQLPADSLLIQDDGQRVAARIGRGRQLPFQQNPHEAPAGDLRTVRIGGRVLLERPWHILEELTANLTDDLQHSDLPPCQRTPGGATFGDHVIRIASDAQVHPMVVIDASAGPVAIDQAAVIGSFAVLTGPCYVGPRSVVSPHTHLRPGTSIGPQCSVGGEISHSVLQACSNKVHAGYLGNSFVGQWVNLGAMTNVSNLKNTYGPIRMQLAARQEAEDTGLTKLGTILGDFVRTAIGTRLITGSCIGTAAMIAVSSFTPRFIDRFSFLTDHGSTVTNLDKLLVTAEHMMQRRGVHLHEAEAIRLRALAAAM